MATTNELKIGNQPPARIRVRVRRGEDVVWQAAWYHVPGDDPEGPRTPVEFAGYGAAELRVTLYGGQSLTIPVTLAGNVSSVAIARADTAAYPAGDGAAELWITDSLDRARAWGVGQMEVV